MAVTDRTFNQTVNWYNSERREQHGCLSYLGANSEYEYTDGRYFQGMQHFVLNASGASEADPKTVTMYEFSNGVKIRMDYYAEVIDPGGSDEEIALYTRYRYVDKDGVLIRTITPDPTYSTMRVNSDRNSISHIDLFFNPSNVYYHDVNITSATRPSSYHYYLAYTYRPDPFTADDPDPLQGDMSYDYLSKYYYWNYSTPISTDEEWDAFNEALKQGGDGTPITPILPSQDTSEPGGGDEAGPEYNPLSDPVSFPGLPTGGDAISTGFIRVYTPTSAQLQSLAGVLWSDSFVDTIKKIQNDPMEAIISLHSLPMSLSSGSSQCRIGNFDTGVTMNTVSSQYVKRDLGSIVIPEHWASALDYGPYNTVDIYLPYVGVRSLQIDDVVGKTLKVEYNVDILSGATVASVMCGNSVLYTYNTSLIAYHPISQSSYGPLLQSTLGAMGNVVSGAVSGGIGGAVGGALGSAINVATSKHSTVSRGGSIGGNSGCLGNFVPYLIIHRPIQSLASGFAHFKGYPSNITATLGSISGYTEVESVHLNGITCTDNEKAEIEALLYNGVIL